MGQLADSYDALEIVEEQTQLGRYRLVGELASGGMATVHLALETEGLGRLVALKTMHPHLSSEPDYVDMFLDEARINGAIDHPNVCKVFDFGQADGCYFIAMEQLSGHTLKGLISRVRKQGRPRNYCSLVIQIVAAACDGLHAAHELRDHNDQPLNVVHRDVSPQNLYLGYDGRLRVVDFGIAHAAGRIQHTSEGVVKGKFSYIAPEQIRSGSEIDCRVDVWSVGIVLWELLTLERLFVRATHADTLMSVMMDPVRPPSEVAEDVPPELDDVALRALSRDREGRFSSAKEMAEALRRIVDEGILPACSEADVASCMQELFPQEQAARREMMNKARELACEGDALGPLSVSLSLPAGARGPRRTSGVVARVKTGGDASAVRMRRTSRPPALPTRSSHPTVPAPTVAERESVVPPENADLPSPQRGRLSAVKRAVLLLGGGLAVAAALLLPEQPLSDAPLEHRNPVAGSDIATGAARGASPLAASADAVDQRAEASLDTAAQVTGEPTGEQPAPSEPAGVDARGQARTPSTPARPTGPASFVSASASQARPARAKPHRPVVLLKPDVPEQPSSPIPSEASSPNQAAAVPARAPAPTPAQTGALPGPNPFGEPSAAEAAGAAAPKAASPSTTPARAEPASDRARQLSPAKADRATPVSAPKPVREPSPPPYAPRDARVHATDLSVQGPLSSSSVLHMLARADGALQSCYRAASARAQRHDTRAVSAQLTIDEMGATRDVRVQSHSLPGLSACAATALKRLRSAKRPDTGRAQISMKLQFELR